MRRNGRFSGRSPGLAAGERNSGPGAWQAIWRGGLLLGTLLAAPAWSGEIAQDERVVFFTSPGWWDSARGCWQVPIRGWIFEAERDSLWRRALLKGLARELGEDHGRLEELGDQLLAERLGYFLVDNERGKEIEVRLEGRGKDPGRVFRMEESSANGQFTGQAEFHEGKEGKGPSWLTLSAVVAAGSPGFLGRVQLLPRTGFSVISDIDDTVKDSQVLDRKALLKNTFLHPYRAIPGMAGSYRQWAQAGAAFHYLSSSPWQLYLPLTEFLRKEGFPDGSYHMRNLRLKDRSVGNLFKSAEETKPPEIREILKRFPERKYLLVGDSGERDPEVYGTIGREFPDRILKIFIRKVANADNSPARLDKAFRDLPPGQWTLFEDPAQLTAFQLPLPQGGAEGANGSSGASVPRVGGVGVPPGGP